MKHRWMMGLLLCVALPAPLLAQVKEPAQRAVAVVMDGKSSTVDGAALAAMPSTTITAATHGDKPAAWQGVALEEILHRAGVPQGEALRGRSMASFIRVTAADGYQVVFSLAELDPGFSHTTVILAQARDGQPLTSDGPFRLVVPGDQRAARWVRNVTTIEVVDGSTRAPR